MTPSPSTLGQDAPKPAKSVCGLCGEPMPPGEEMFNYHGYSGPCPKPPLPDVSGGRYRDLWKMGGGAFDKKGHAWIETDLLPELLQKIVDAVAPLKSQPLRDSTLGQDADLIAEIEKRPGAAYLMDRLRSYGHNTRKDRNKTLCELMLNAADEIERLLKSRQPHVTLTLNEDARLSRARKAHEHEWTGAVSPARLSEAYIEAQTNRFHLLTIIDRVCLTKAEAP